MSFLVAAVALLVACLPAVARAQVEPAPPCRANAADRRVDERRYVPIGGIEQWITIAGADCTNPVLLFVHGGPGNPLSPISDALYGDWERDFTIVQWDQRLAGRTYLRNEPVTELTEARFHAVDLTIPQLVADGLEVTEYLRLRLGAERVILTGTSWGSVLAVHMVLERPDLYYAYVGLSQFVTYRDNLATSYALVRDEAQRRADAQSLATLDELGPPPWENPRNFGRLRRIIRAYEADMTTAGPAWTPAPEYSSDRERAAYTAGEDISFLKFVGLRGDGMAAGIDLPALGTTFAVPVFLIQGEEDLLTPLRDHASVLRPHHRAGEGADCGTEGGARSELRDARRRAAPAPRAHPAARRRRVRTGRDDRVARGRPARDVPGRGTGGSALGPRAAPWCDHGRPLLDCVVVPLRSSFS